MSQNRKYRRIPAQLISHFRRGTSEEAQTQNISFGGAFIETNMSFSVNQTVDFEIVLPGGEQHVEVEAVVRWVNRDHPKGIGVEFIKVTAPNKIALRRYINLLMEKKQQESGRMRAVTEKSSSASD